MIAKLFDIKKTNNKGKGLFAKEDILKGTIICFECKKDQVINKKDFNKLVKSKRKSILEYAYTRKDGSVLTPCDETIFLNHSCNSNILDTGKNFDIVVKDIKKGEEATYDYRTFYENSNFSLDCNCGEENCCHTIRCIHPIQKELQEFWNRKINGSIPLIKKVKQPLMDEILKQRKDLIYIFR